VRVTQLPKPIDQEKAARSSRSILLNHEATNPLQARAHLLPDRLCLQEGHEVVYAPLVTESVLQPLVDVCGYSL
jgi:hypothetical protein